jgi:hypothetical protein
MEKAGDVDVLLSKQCHMVEIAPFRAQRMCSPYNLELAGFENEVSM